MADVKIDMGWKGPMGPDFRIRGEVVYLYGSDHWLEYLHHVMPFAGFRERRWAQEVVDTLDALQIVIYTISGHSLGGTIACEVADIYRGRGQHVGLYTYGAKRPRRGVSPDGYHYAVKHDPVPGFPWWRPSLPLRVLDYGELTPVEAHGPRIYYEQMERDGTR